MNAPSSKIEASATPALVYSKIAAIQGELAKVGIAKNRRNQQQGYNFRGIDEVYAALSPLLASHGLVIVPRMLSRECIEGQTKRGDPLFRVTVHAEFDFIAAEDGSIHVAATYGEAMDSADKATNKAMSAAYKYAAFMTFAIPTEGDNDADATTHDVASTSGSGDQGQNGGRKVSPDTGPATDEQAGEMPDVEYAKIINLLKATNSDAGPMLKHYGVKNIRQLSQAQFGDAIQHLNNKLATMAKADTNKAAASFGEVLEDEIPY